MLKKSNRSAIIMSGIAFLSALLTMWAWGLFYFSLKTDLESESQMLSVRPQNIAIIIPAILIALILIVLPGAFIIHNWNETYFGKEGAIRWGVFGIAFGCLAQTHHLIPFTDLDNSLISFAIDKAFNLGLGLAALYVSHFLAFKSFKRNR
jgi:hypothetical protein